ncbi:MAG: DUF4401 domain-containing protein [Ginsengibacter sp.]|jgi:uncharacterized membrane protein
MINKETIQELLDYFQHIEKKDLKFNKEAIEVAFQKNNAQQSLAIKVLSIFGGLLASIAFFGFFYITGLYNSELGLLVFGILFITSAFLININNEKLMLDAVSVSLFIIGGILFGMGLAKLEITNNGISIAFMIIAILSIFIGRNYILTFISVLIFNGAIIALILSNNNYELIHLYISAHAVLITYFFLKEAKIITINKSLSKLYNPIRIGLIFSFIGGLALITINGITHLSPQYIWISSVINIAFTIYVLSHLFELLNITQTKYKIGIYVISILLLVPTALSPAISGAILIILLSFLVNYKTAFVIGIIALIYFISQYYYDLNFTLLTKSILLFSSGVLFLLLYLFTHKNLTQNEKI